MIKITPIGESYIIENEISFGTEAHDEKYITLRPHANIDDILAEMQKKIIDFPGEYDISNNYIKAINGKWNEMNYFIKTKKKSFAIIQSPKALEHDEMINVQNRIYTNEKVLKKLEQLELEGEKIPLHGESTEE